MKTSIFIALVAIASFVGAGCVHTTTTTATNTTTDGERGISSVTDLNAPWAYDPGPDPNTAMGRELIEIVASQPYMPGISLEMTGTQKFRPAFGPTLWRMIQAPNSIKILFLGQDGTHIAEAAGRTATAGFGGRAQDMAAHFGVENSAAFMNAFAFTIKGQYAGAGVPVISEFNGKKQVSLGTVVDNGIWLMAQDINSPMAKWRNKLIDWIIRNNKDSLKLVLLFVGAAQDSIGSFIESHGGKVGSRYSVEDLAAKKIKVPSFKAASAGSNKEVAIPLDKNDKDAYASLLDMNVGDPANPTKVTAAQNALKANIDKVYSDLAISNGGAGGSGVIHPAQIGGYDLTKIVINGQNTISLKGLKLNDGSSVNHDVLIAEFPHPTYLSAKQMELMQSVGPAKASAELAKFFDGYLAPLKPWRAHWNIDADPGQVNHFAKGEPYHYGRADIGPAFYDFGTPKNRMVSVSSASRLNPNVVVIGTRERPSFDQNKLKQMVNAPAPAGISNEELFSSRPRLPQTSKVFDRGPGEEMARLMKENLDIALIGKMKDGHDANPNCKTPEPASKFNVKTHPLCVGDFGHYRGTFNQPKVLIVADPDGVDDILTSRALTGTRGQYLQGLMNDLGVPEQYLVFKTVPFGMDGATPQEWGVVLQQTNAYRQKVIQAVMAAGSVKLVIADGTYAAQEVARLGLKIPVVKIARSGTENGSGIKEAASAINATHAFASINAKGAMASIPRSHLGFFSRVWEGTSGSHVLDSNAESDKGSAFAIVVPNWVSGQKNVKQSAEERQSVDGLHKIIQQQNIPSETEKFLEFIQHGGGHGSYRVFTSDLLAS
jgi:hypothetical protein